MAPRSCRATCSGVSGTCCAAVAAQSRVIATVPAAATRGTRGRPERPLGDAIQMHANSELMGALPEREWIPRAPTLARKISLVAKVQDEVGHAQLLYRVAEDLGKPRRQMIEELLAGRSKFHNVFHYPADTWADVAVIQVFVDRKSTRLNSSHHSI